MKEKKTEWDWWGDYVAFLEMFFVMTYLPLCGFVVVLWLTRGGC